MVGQRTLILLALVSGTVATVSRGQEGESRPSPHDWKHTGPRAEIEPAFGFEEGPPLLLAQSGRGIAGVDGRWVREVEIEGGQWYGFSVDVQIEGVETPLRSVLTRVEWRDGQGNRVEQPEYPPTKRGETKKGWTRIAGTYRAPSEAKRARLELHFRWAPDGKVTWQDMKWELVEAPGPRLARLATVNHRPRDSKGPAANLVAFGKLVHQAADQGADIVCLPEGITVVGTDKSYEAVAEPIPGPSTENLGTVAAERKIYVVAGLYERDGGTVYNTSVLIGRDGKLIGRYRKVCLPREEIDGGITPGTETPVFETDFGRVGMMICWDVHFPEVARRLGEGGAEVILMPIWGGNRDLAEARAIENQLYLVTSGYDFETAIFDPTGKALAETRSDPAVIVTEVDLNKQVLWPWLGDFKSRIPREGPAPTSSQK